MGRRSRRQSLPPPPIERDDDGFAVQVGPSERAALRHLGEQLRALLRSEHPASDPAVARLFPPAYPDDVMANLEFEHKVGDELVAGRLAAIDTLLRSADATHLTEDEVLAWLDATVTARLVLGTRLDVTEGSTEADFADDPATAEAFAFYAYLTWLQESIVTALAN